MNKLFYFSMMSTVCLILQACGPSVDSGSDPSDLANSASQSAPPAIKSNWTKSESKDPFTDEVTRRYAAEIVSGGGELVLSCSEQKKINVYYNYQRPRTYFSNQAATVRLDSDPPREEPWIALDAVGSSWPKSANFINEMIGKSRLAIELFAKGSAVFDIAGTEEAVNGLKEVGCSLGAPVASHNEQPQPNNQVSQPTIREEQNFNIYASLPENSSQRLALTQDKIDSLKQCGIMAVGDYSNRYQGMTNGLYVTITGPHTDKSSARAELANAKNCGGIEGYTKQASFTGRP